MKNKSLVLLAVLFFSFVFLKCGERINPDLESLSKIVLKKNGGWKKDYSRAYTIGLRKPNYTLRINSVDDILSPDDILSFRGKRSSGSDYNFDVSLGGKVSLYEKYEIKDYYHLGFYELVEGKIKNIVEELEEEEKEFRNLIN